MVLVCSGSMTRLSDTTWEAVAKVRGYHKSSYISSVPIVTNSFVTAVFCACISLSVRCMGRLLYKPDSSPFTHLFSLTCICHACVLRFQCDACSLELGLVRPAAWCCCWQFVSDVCSVVLAGCCCYTGACAWYVGRFGRKCACYRCMCVRE